MQTERKDRVSPSFCYILLLTRDEFILCMCWITFDWVINEVDASERQFTLTSLLESIQHRWIQTALWTQAWYMWVLRTSLTHILETVQYHSNSFHVSSFSLQWYETKKKVKLICNYFTFKYIEASLLKVVFSASLSLSKASAKFGIISTCDPEAPHHRPCAWKHRCAISCVKLLLRTGSVHFAKVGINVSEVAGTAFC